MAGVMDTIFWKGRGGQALPAPNQAEPAQVVRSAALWKFSLSRLQQRARSGSPITASTADLTCSKPTERMHSGRTKR